MTKKRLYGGFVILALLCVALFWALHAERDGAKDSLNFRLKWLFYSSFGEHLVSDKLGYFHNAGLNVNIRPGGAGIDPLKLVASGEDDVGLASYGQILIACQKGLPIVAIGQSNISSGVVFISLKSSGITDPGQFIGKRVGVIPGSDTGSVYAAVMSKLQLDRSKVEEIPIGFSVDPLLNGSIDVSTAAFSTNQPLFIENKGIPVNIIDPKNYGITVGGNVFFARREFLENNKDLLRRFLRADFQGTAKALGMKDEEVVNTVLSY
ncbi:MAG: ABC transporter substrate-binding protein, partial [Fimbriimonadaceae bacterium]